ncbi:hypothetical protein [Salinigranum marinum]|uniref:hypothetical protein n=1 Tax=Salinigranum marinum TaxID=1515595 RepID=UPI002989C741|nr:hypothetical protein [Salinigranum marinum]
MPAISITDDQRERLRWIQARLEDDVEYGHVRPRDALEFLLDRADEAGELSPAMDTDPEEMASDSGPEETASDSASTTASTDTPGRTGGFVVMNGGDVAASGGLTGLGDDRTGAVSADADAGEDATETAEDAAGSEDPTTSSPDPTSDSDETEDEANDEARLNSVMSLLDDHDGKWRETGGGEEKYEVDLPDGGAERARTKDDVRAVLFRHYR